MPTYQCIVCGAVEDPEEIPNIEFDSDADFDICLPCAGDIINSMKPNYLRSMIRKIAKDNLTARMLKSNSMLAQ